MDSSIDAICSDISPNLTLCMGGNAYDDMNSLTTWQGIKNKKSSLISWSISCGSHQYTGLSSMQKLNFKWNKTHVVIPAQEHEGHLNSNYKKSPAFTCFWN